MLLYRSVEFHGIQLCVLSPPSGAGSSRHGRTEKAAAELWEKEALDYKLSGC